MIQFFENYIYRTLAKQYIQMWPTILWIAKQKTIFKYSYQIGFKNKKKKLKS